MFLLSYSFFHCRSRRSMANIRRALAGILILLQTNSIVKSLATITSGQYRIEYAWCIQSRNKIFVIKCLQIRWKKSFQLKRNFLSRVNVGRAPPTIWDTHSLSSRLWCCTLPSTKKDLFTSRCAGYRFKQFWCILYQLWISRANEAIYLILCLCWKECFYL